jgi:hypothetical protein
MNKIVKILSVGFIALALLVSVCGTGFSEEMTSISGVVTADNQLLGDDGQMYSVADDQSGQDLLQNVEKKVEVKGTVSEKEGMKQIVVKSFKVME